MTAITIYHNPRCGTSRTVLSLIREAGIEPEVVEYLKTPLNLPQLRVLVAATGQPVRALLREKEALCAELGLDQPGCSDEQLLQAMAQHPVLMNRPVVVSPRGTRLCRPADTVRSLLP